MKYGEALGAERLVDTSNVCVSVTAGAYSTARLVTKEQRAELDWSFWHDDGMSEGYSNMVKPQQTGG